VNVGVVFLLRTGVLIFFLLFMVQSWIIEGGRLESCSMSPAFFGPRLILDCPECRFRFHVNETNEVSWQAVCPHCGFAEVPVSGGVEKPGDTIFCFKGQLRNSCPKRFDVVLFRNPEKPGEKVVKRVIGLPGETVSIAGGDIFIDGKRLLKPFSVQQQTRIPVEYGIWENQEDFLSFSPRKPVPHFRNMFLTEPEASAGFGITNERAENQWLGGRAENTSLLQDLMLELDWDVSEEKPLEIMIFDHFCVQFSVSGEMIHVKYEQHEHYERLAKKRRITISTFDRHLLLAVNGKMVFCIPFEEHFCETWGIGKNEKTSFRIKGAGVHHQKVFCDIYHTETPDCRLSFERRNSVTVPENSLYVLGDNSRFSEDSRAWETPFLPIKNVIGRVMVFGR